MLEGFFDPLETCFSVELALDGGGFAFNVSEDRIHLGRVAQYFSFKTGDKIVGGTQGHLFVKFEMLLNSELLSRFATIGLNTEFMYGDVVARGNGADAIENAFGARLAGDSVDDYIGVWNDTLNGAVALLQRVHWCVRM